MSNTKKIKLSLGTWIFLSVILIIGAIFLLVKNSTEAQQEENRRIENNRQMDRQLENAKKRAEDKVNAEYYDKCMANAFDSYTEQWNEVAAQYDYPDNKLPQSEAEFLDDRYKTDKDECVRLYKQ